MSKICLRGGDEEVCPSLSVVPVVELCNQQCSGLFLAMLVSVRLSVVRKGPRSALACLSASSCGGGEEACPLFDGQEGFENKGLVLCVRSFPTPVACRKRVRAASTKLLARSWTLGWVDRSASGVHRSARPFYRRYAPGLNWPGRASGAVTLKKLECSKQAYALNTLAWDNIIGFRRTTAKAFAKDVFINQERKLGARRRSDTVLVSTINDADQGSADVTFRTPPAPYEKSKFLGSGGSMVARLKLKGIDGRAPPGVEPAA
ncbi:unnamed protein product [Malus baccata var. baccata]